MHPDIRPSVPVNVVLPDPEVGSDFGSVVPSNGHGVVVAEPGAVVTVVVLDAFDDESQAARSATIDDAPSRARRRRENGGATESRIGAIE
jgi:hypothetical protein